MGIRDEIQSELAEAFDDDLSDVVVNFSLVRLTVGDYDPTTDSNLETEEVYLSRGIFSAYPSDKIDGIKILAGDEKVTILANEIVTEPAIEDFIVPEFGVLKYKVINTKPVMGGGSIPITYSLQVRKNG